MSETLMKSNMNISEEKLVTYNEIASKLLNDKLLLTALELHTELIESGREVKQLRDFFANASNFEQQHVDFAISMPRSGSQVTLDSLDLARFSEDGERALDERVAVLEFELRKAKETISALRANLTMATESENGTPDERVMKPPNTGSIKPHEQRALNFLINEYLLTYNYKLTSITFADENENQDFEDWNDVGLNIPKPVELLALYRDSFKQIGHRFITVSCQTDFLTFNEEKQQLILNLQLEVEQLKQEYSKLESAKMEMQSKCDTPENTSTQSLSPETFEVIEKSAGSLITLDDDGSTTTSLTENDVEWTRIAFPVETVDGKRTNTPHSQLTVVLPTNSSDRHLSIGFERELQNLCYGNMWKPAEHNKILENVTNETLVHVVSQSLVRIVPNIILNKRDEVIPLLVCAVQLNETGSERELMLQLLFNLKKRPTKDERRLILAGLRAIAHKCGPPLVENEVLPQCWEQLTHKHVEKRLLVADACIVLAPYVSGAIRNSLMLSMVQQLLEDRDASVKEAALKALALIISCCDDIDKYAQCESLVLATLTDTNANVSNCSIQILMPVLAEWALSIEKFQCSLLTNILQKLNGLVKLSQFSDESIIQLVHVLETLLPFLFVYVTAVQPIATRLTEELIIEIENTLQYIEIVHYLVTLGADFLKLCTPLTNPRNFYGGSKDIGMIFYEFHKVIAEEPVVTWPELDWFLQIVLPDLLNSVNHIDVTHHAVLKSLVALFTHLCTLFGAQFTRLKVKPLFRTHIQTLEQMLVNFNQYNPNFSMIPIYLISVLGCCDDGDDLETMLKRFVCALPLCGTPLDCLEVSVRGLCVSEAFQETVANALWDGVVHQRPLVRSATAALFACMIGAISEQLLAVKVTPALVTLANDSDILVRTATLPALASLITDCNVAEVHDKAYMQLQSLLSDSTSRDNHAMLRQLVIILGHVVNACDVWFREEVIVPQLTAMSAYTSQMSNQTRKMDMASALIESFSATIYCPLSRNTISTVLLPGLKYLELVDSRSLAIHHNTVVAMIRETEARLERSAPGAGAVMPGSLDHSTEDVRQRVSKIFTSKSGHIPKTNAFGTNLQNMFRKK